MTVSIEDRKVFAALAKAIANCLECPACPRALTESLLEIIDPLEQAIVSELDTTPHAITCCQLRALAGLAESGDGKARAEGESTLTGQLSASASA
jgi:hypothetical protein